MRILKKVNIDRWRHIKKCYYCFSELEINQNDVKYDNCSKLYFTCSVCKSINKLECSEIPHSVMDHIGYRLEYISPKLPKQRFIKCKDCDFKHPYDRDYIKYGFTCIACDNFQSSYRLISHKIIPYYRKWTWRTYLT